MRKSLPLLGALILIGLFLGWWFHPSNVLKRRVSSLFDTAEVPLTMSELARSSRGPNVAEYLDERITVDVPEDLRDQVAESYHRDNTAAYYSATARYCRQISFLQPEFTKISIEGDRAEVALEIDAIVELPDRRPVDGILKMELAWVKVDGKWLLNGISWEENPR